MEIHPDHVGALRDAIGLLIADSGTLINSHRVTWTDESQAALEVLNSPMPELARGVLQRGLLSMEAAGDHLMAFRDTIVEPAKTIAPWTCVRGLMESSALACWLLDPAIDSRIRVARCFAFRFAGFDQQIKYLRTAGELEMVEGARRRMVAVEGQAKSMGFDSITDSKGKIAGIAMRMPSLTDLIRETLDFESQYRLFSAVAHGHHWATHQVGFGIASGHTSNPLNDTILVKRLDPAMAVYVGITAISCFARVLWYLWRVFGWPVDEVNSLLDSVCTKASIAPRLRFWH